MYNIRKSVLLSYLTIFFYILVFFSIFFIMVYYDFEFDFISEMVLLNNIIFGFGYFLIKTSMKKDKNFFNYLLFLIYAFIVYILLSLSEIVLSPGLNFNSFFLIDAGALQIKVIVACFFLFFLVVLYFEIILVRFYNLELLFIFALIAWVCVFSCFSFNFLFLFFTMELLTILLVILMAIYFIFVGTRLLKPVTQFFVLNIVISVFFLLGFCLLLYSLLYFNTFNASYLILVHTYINYLLLGFSTKTILVFFKVISSFFILPFIFKLTFAPFSIWIINVYTHIPLVLLMVLMTIYKIIYSFIYIRIFIGILDVLVLEPFSAFTNGLMLCFIIPSLFVGCLAFKQMDLKMFLAYTTVSQIAYIFTGLLTNNVLAMSQSLAYLIVYCVHLLLIFSIFLIIKKKYNITNINEIFIVRFYDKYLFFTLLLIFFSLAGIPPLGGFAVKIYLFLQVYAAGHQLLAAISLFTGFLMSIIYLKISIKLFLPKNTFYFNLQHITYKKEFLIKQSSSKIFILFVYTGALFIFTYFLYADFITYILVDLVKHIIFYS